MRLAQPCPQASALLPMAPGTVTYSHAINFTLCEQAATVDYLVISCTFEVEHYVWLATDLVPVMTATEAPVVVRVPRTVEQTIEADRFVFQIFPGLLVARHTAYPIRSFTFVQSSSWIASSSMCTLSTNGLSFSCILDPVAVAGEHRADFRVVFMNDEASSVGILASVHTYYIGKYAPNIFGTASLFTLQRRTCITAPLNPSCSCTSHTTRRSLASARTSRCSFL